MNSKGVVCPYVEQALGPLCGKPREMASRIASPTFRAFTTAWLGEEVRKYRLVNAHSFSKDSLRAFLIA